MKFFGCHWREVIQGFVRALVVEEGDPVQGLQFDVLDPSPGTFGSDELGLVEPDLGLGESVEAPIDVKSS